MSRDVRGPLTSGGTPLPSRAVALRRPGARAGRRETGWPGLEEGEEADLVVYPEDPREDLAALASPSLVVLRGRPVA